MYLPYGANPVKKVGEILLLSETGELRDVVEPDIDDTRNLCHLQRFEEPGRRLLRESDSIDSHHTAWPAAALGAM